MEKKSVELKLSTLEADGTFTGLLSAYGNVDDGLDVVERGAFTKTLRELRGKVLMLWQHKHEEPIGALELIDSPEGLQVKGTLNLDDAVPTAKRAYSMMKFLKDHGLKMGMSIGFETVKKEFKDGVRYLKELRLLEGSLVSVPMNDLCRVGSVKSTGEESKDFLSSLEAIQLYASKYQLLDALGWALDDVLYSGGDDAAEKAASAAVAIDQFRDTYLEWLPKLLALWGMKDFPSIDRKAGRTFSAANRKRVEDVIASLQALIAEAGTSEEAAEDAKGKEPPSAKSAEPGIDLHSVHELFASFRLTKAA